MGIDLKKVVNNLEDIYKRADSFMLNIPSVCSKGCSFCCHQNITVVNAEELVMTKFINKYFGFKTKETVKNNILNWYKYFNENTPDKILDYDDIFSLGKLIAKDKIPCPFLINEECSIYNARPLVCRIHSVNNSPKECDNDRLRNASTDTFQIKKDLLKEMLSSTPYATLHPLIYSLREYFEINFNFKMIKVITRI